MANIPHSNIELKISCRHLLNKDLLSKSDPQVIVYTAAPNSRGWTEFARTEQIKDNLNPNFAKPVLITYLFEEVQKLRFAVYDIDKQNGTLDQQDFLGYYETTLAAIVSASGQAIQKPLEHPQRKKAGYIKVVAEEQTDLKHVIKMTFHGRDLDKKDFFGKSDPYFQISRTQEDGTSSVVYRSKHILKTLDPTWPPAVVPISTLCNGDLDRQLIFEVYDWDKNGSDDLIGSFSASANELLGSREMMGAQRKEYALINQKKKSKKKNYKCSGYFQVLQFHLEEVPSFLDYLAGGTNLALAVAIDFTGSNGDPRTPSSLHFLDPNRRNHYQEAILAVGSILEPYDSDKQFPVYGFGAKLSDGSISHCFALNGDVNNPHVFGVNGVLDVYNHAMPQITLWGPTNFSPIVNQVAAQIRTEEARMGPGLNYTVLMIITDGAITDQDATVRAIVEASSLPLSIVIVGVGNADFTNMHTLDGDDAPLVSNGRRCERDIVQFVPFNQYSGNPHLLAKEVLAEIPDQMVGFMRAHGVKPRMRRAHSFASIASQDSLASRSATISGFAPPAANLGRHATAIGLRNHDPNQMATGSASNTNINRSQTLMHPPSAQGFLPAYTSNGQPNTSYDSKRG
ncbi:hypothetical protein PhCBS80983_g00457 [Powellomyces hirtus]|uniref:Copine-3 n=1 Tax=Powellomyces hirtus TaxID=109895 RepID=A0A507EDG9_9FUNG|nr:hypothetical protein PhCBS80983_g00457 [Powellomyces hirtus]